MGVQLKGGKSPPRNSPCPCGSGLKFKWCHGDSGKQAVCNRLVNEKMVQLIREEQKRQGLVPRNYRCQNCGHTFDEPNISSFAPDMKICPKCSNTEIEKIAEEL
jgi:predicted Zn-ribbon and HTH transcriptional regulator